MTLSDFKKKWGEQWATIVRGEMWRDALTVSDSKSNVFRVANLSPEYIKDVGSELLATQKGYAIAVHTLTHLHEFADLDFKAAPTEDYPDPVKEFQDLNPAASKPPKKKK